MAVTNFIQTVWSKNLQDDLEAKCKLVGNCLRTYEGDCAHARTVKILGIGDPTISVYDGKTKLTYEELDDCSQELLIDQARSFSFLVDDIDQAQSVPGMKEAYQRKAVQGLALERDTYVAGLIKNAQHVTVCADLNPDAVKEAIDEAIIALRERNFDEEGVIELTPAAYNVFKNYLLTLSTPNPTFIRKGIVGVYDDFPVVMCNNLIKDENYAYCDVRGKNAIAFVGQINDVEALRSPDYFKDLVRGLDTFGAKIIDQDRIQVIKVPLQP